LSLIRRQHSFAFQTFNSNLFEETQMSAIVDIIGREVIDSRGNPNR
jgi:hypothetical protein